MTMRKTLRAFVAFTMLLPAGVLLAERVELRLALQPGQSWSFEQTQDSRSDNKATGGGMSQPFTTVNSSRRSGKVEVLAVEGGLPTSLRVTFDEGLESSMEMVGQGRQSMPFPYSGKTITLNRDAGGRITDDSGGQVDPAAQNELHGLMDQGVALYPKGPVDVGQEWQADPQLVARMMQLQGPNDMAGMTLKLLSIKDVDGRPTAEVKVSVAVDMQQQGLKSTVISQGTTLVDLASGHTVKTDLKGTTKVEGQQQGPGPNGQPIAYQIEGNGTITIAAKTPFINAGNAVAARPAQPVANDPIVGDGGGPNPLANNPLAAATDPIAGSYTDGKLKLELAGGDGSYKGTITLGAQTFPATATSNGGKLEGTFQAGANKFPFVATVGEYSMKFETGGTTYTLKKTASPKPAAPANPLAPGARGVDGNRGGVAPVAQAVAAEPVAPPKPAPAVALQTYNFPDGTGSIGLAPGWSTNATTCQSGFTIVGPRDQKLSVGMVVSVNTPNSTAVRMQMQMEAQARQMGMAPPPRVPMLVAPFCSPQQAMQALVPQLSAISQANGGPSVEVGNLAVVKSLKADLPNGQAELLRYDVRETGQGRQIVYSALSNVQTTPLSNESWMFYAMEARAPQSTFDADLPVMLQMLNSWKTDAAAMQRVTDRNIDNSNRVFAAGQAAHRDRMAAFDSYNKSWWDRQKSQDRSHADFIETIRGTRTIEDTRTGERRDADLGHSKDIVDNLNERDPDRFREVPLRDQ